MRLDDIVSGNCTDTDKTEQARWSVSVVAVPTS